MIPCKHWYINTAPFFPHYNAKVTREGSLLESLNGKSVKIREKHLIRYFYWKKRDRASIIWYVWATGDLLGANFCIKCISSWGVFVFGQVLPPVWVFLLCLPTGNWRHLDVHYHRKASLSATEKSKQKLEFVINLDVYFLSSSWMYTSISNVSILTHTSCTYFL